MDVVLEEKKWWGYVHEDIKELIRQSLLLVDTVSDWPKEMKEKLGFHDYAFVVFPAAKSYEGFLKKLFLDLGMISEEDYYGKRFRVGKALNPSLDKKYRDESVYDKLVAYCNGPKLADYLWETWRNCRNVVFHWFPNEKNAITESEAKERVYMVIEAMDMAFSECRIDQKQ